MAGNTPLTANDGCLLTGIIIDAGGAEMIPSRFAASGVSQAYHYVSVADPSAFRVRESVHAARTDKCVVAILRRAHLVGDDERRDEILAILRRVVVLEDAVVLQLDKRLCLAIWRAQEPILRRISTGDVLRLLSTSLASDVEISEIGNTVCLRVLRHGRARTIRARRSRPTLLFRGA